MPELATKIVRLPWVADGIDMGEFNAFMGLIRLADTGHTTKLIEEPWVVEGRNYPALESLGILATHPERFNTIMTHPTISDGITDQEAKILATLTAAADTGFDFDYPDLSDKLLDSEQVTLEERTITLPLAGETELTIIRTGPGADLTMDFLEHSVRSIEEFMGLPFPRRHVIYLFAQAAGGGSYFGTHVGIWVNEQNQSRESMLTLLSHEAGHYYWEELPHWMEEGAATFLTSMAMNTLQGTPENGPCPLARNIVEFEGLKGDLNPFDYRDCPYSLGERLFRDLYRNMDDTSFRLAFRRLYLHKVFNVSDIECDEHWTNICHVKESFTTHAPEESAGKVGKVIARWYDGTEPYDPSFIDDAPVEADIAAIDGRIEGSYLTFSAVGLPVSAVTFARNSSAILYMRLDYSYRHSSDLKNLPIEVVLYFEDGFEAHHRETILPVPAEDTRRTTYVRMDEARASGRYWVHLYFGQQKIAEETFEVVTALDPHSIRGVVNDPDGQPVGRIMLNANRRGETFSAEAGQNGAFDVVVPSGPFILEVYLLVGTQWKFVGWHDVNGGVTFDLDQAFELTVDGADVKGIEIILPTDTEGLLCPSGLWRSLFTGLCRQFG